MTAEDDDGLMTPEEMQEEIFRQKGELIALKSVMLDVLVIFAVTDPEAIGKLRDMALHLAQKVTDGRFNLPDPEISHRVILAHRLEMLETAMARVGSPHVSADVIPIKTQSPDD